MDWLKGFVASIWSFVCLVSVVGSEIIVVAIIMTSTANAITITKLAPDPLYLLPAGSGELIVTISEPAETGGQSVVLSADSFIVVVPGTVVVPQGETTAPITVTSIGIEGEALVTAAIELSNVSARIIITKAIPTVSISGAISLLLLE
jgi:hypothetical protein